ncbi:MAG TPA: helix-turn-helix domain-containing protein [Solirubrobacteraceae bacterium]|nr:helix-turn-helix domain-containing protein [Solirubrobacteraceae bacterium]
MSERPASVSSRPELTLSGRVRLLEVDPELGSRLSGEELARARESAMVPALHLTQGRWDIQQLRRARGVRGGVYGFVLASGAITLDVSLGARTATRALARGELILLDGWDNDTLPARWGWTVLEPSTIGVIDERLELIAQRWPKLMTSLVIRAADQARHAMLQQAISQLPRVEDRLLAAMWSLADTRGVVRQDGILVPLSLTHEALAQMVGARRPTVSLGLKALSMRGLLRATAEGWVIARDSLDGFLADDPGSRNGCVDPPD